MKRVIFIIEGSIFLLSAVILVRLIIFVVYLIWEIVYFSKREELRRAKDWEKDLNKATREGDPDKFWKRFRGLSRDKRD